MSNRAKGSAAELRAQKLLESQGYFCHRAVYSGFRGAGGGFMSRSNDVWGLFDLLASRYDTRLRCIQVTAGGSGDASARRNAIAEVSARFPEDHCSLEVWRWRPGRKSKAHPLCQSWSAWEWLDGAWFELEVSRDGV